MTFLKILSFPIRLVLFLLLAALSGIIFMINITIGMVLCAASGLIRALGVGFMILATGNFVITYILDYDTLSLEYPIWQVVIVTAVLLLIMAIFYFLPVISQTAVTLVQAAVMWIWYLAKTILFCRNCF